MNARTNVLQITSAGAAVRSEVWFHTKGFLNSVASHLFKLGSESISEPLITAYWEGFLFSTASDPNLGCWLPIAPDCVFGASSQNPVLSPWLFWMCSFRPACLFFTQDALLHITTSLLSSTALPCPTSQCPSSRLPSFGKPRSGQVPDE